MRVFSINMKDNTERKEYIVNECAKYSLNVEIIEAVAGKELSEAELREAVLNYEMCDFTKGEIGCALSHQKIYRKIVEDGIDIALILEDDATLSDNIKAALDDVEIFNNKNHKPALFLLTKVEKYISSFPTYLEHITLFRFHKGWCALGYAINRKGAEVLLKRLYPIKVVADHWLYVKFYTSLTIYCVVPHIAHVVDYKNEMRSTLDSERTEIDKAKRDIYHKRILRLNVFPFLKWRLYRIFIRPFFRVKGVDCGEN
jgi:glycosyl transferase family 25